MRYISHLKSSKQKNVFKFQFGNKKSIRILAIFSTIFVLISIIPFPISGTHESFDEPIINYLHIETKIDNSYSITQVTEEFHNPYDYSIDTTFKFKIPNKAFISNFTITIGNETYYAEITPKNVARQKYEKAVIEGKDAGLLESRDKNLFSYSVSLSANQTFTVGLRYEEFLEKTLDIYEYSLIPITIENSQEIKEFSVEIIIDSASEITKLDTHNYQTSTIWEDSKKVIIRYNDKDILPKDEFLIEYMTKEPPLNGRMLNYNDGDESYFFHVFSPQKTDLNNTQLDIEIIFLLDKSGSMKGTKIQQLKDAFSHTTNELPSNDSFNVILFDSTVTNYQEKLLFATDDNKNDACDFINSKNAGGSTNLNDALVNGLKMFEDTNEKVPIVVMLTDGVANSGEFTTPPAIRENILKKNEEQVSIFCLGFGNYVDFNFLKALSLENYGYAIRIYEGVDAGEQITHFYETISTPLLREIEFNYKSAKEIYPNHVDYLFEGSEIVVVGKNYELNSITSNVTAYSKEGQINFDEEYNLEYSNKYSFIPRFWAYSKINHLLDVIAVNGEKNSTISQIVELAMEYNFVTPYTSLLIEINGDEEDEDTESKDESNNDKTYTSKNSGSNKMSTPNSDHNSTGPYKDEKYFEGGSPPQKSEDGSFNSKELAATSPLNLCFTGLIVIVMIGIVLMIKSRKRKK